MPVNSLKSGKRNPLPFVSSISADKVCLLRIVPPSIFGARTDPGELEMPAPGERNTDSDNAAPAENGALATLYRALFCDSAKNLSGKTQGSRFTRLPSSRAFISADAVPVLFLQGLALLIQYRAAVPNLDVFHAVLVDVTLLIPQPAAVFRRGRQVFPVLAADFVKQPRQRALFFFAHIHPPQ